MKTERKICAVVPVKDTRQAKQRLAGVLDAARRRELALAMLEDVLAAVARVPELAGILVVTLDRAAIALARRHGVPVVGDGAHAGHSGAVAMAARQLATEDFAMLTLPGDVPLIEPQDIRELIGAHRAASGDAFTIVPARDDRGSNAVLCSPADAVPLRFGNDSFLPHCEAMKKTGKPLVVLELPGISLDIDNPHELELLVRRAGDTHAQRLLRFWGVGSENRAALEAAG